MSSFWKKVSLIRKWIFKATLEKKKILLPIHILNLHSNFYKSQIVIQSVILIGNNIRQIKNEYSKKQSKRQKKVDKKVKFYWKKNLWK